VFRLWFILGLFGSYILRYVDKHGARPSFLRYPEGVPDRIGKVVDVLESQVIKNKSKFEKKSAKESIKSLNAYGDEDDGSSGVIEYKKYSLKPMTLEEAIMQMTSRKKQLFVYCDIDTKRVNAVYRLGDGQFGLIEPEA
jgi:putative sigma-54 modulation protein